MSKRAQLPVVVVHSGFVWIGAPGWWFRLTPAQARTLSNELLAVADEAENVTAAEAS